jgi:hypothetical protein
MRTTQIRRRLDALSARIRPGRPRRVTLEELCRSYWKQDRQGFRSLVTKEMPGYRVFLEMFEREEADRSHGGRTSP